MACRNTFHFGNCVLHESNTADNVGQVPARIRGPMSDANFRLLEEFVCYCEAKKINFVNGNVQEGKESLSNEGKLDDSSCFKDDIHMEFGDQLPVNVVDALCKLVCDSTHGKCWACKLPAESLVLGVLRILSDAAHFRNELKENVAPPAVAPNVLGSDGTSVAEALSVRCSQYFPKTANNKNIVDPKISSTKVEKDANASVIPQVHPYVPTIDPNSRSIANDQLSALIGLDVKPVLNDHHIAQGSHHPIKRTRSPNHDCTAVASKRVE